jgi:dihydroorotase
MIMKAEEVTIRTPDDFHVHFRQGKILEDVVPFTSRVFRRALVMPNTVPPILTADDVIRYRTEIIKAAQNPGFEPLMTIKLTAKTTPETIVDAKRAGIVAVKLYPEGVTTNSGDGVPVHDLTRVYPVLSAMQQLGIVLSIHGEVPGRFVLEREDAFLPILHQITRKYPDLRIVLEHITTEKAVRFVESALPNVAATITLHHLLITLDDVLCDRKGGSEGINPHHYCKPVAKTPDDRRALLVAATSGNPKFFFGSDSAPHLREKKECSCGCAGVWNAPNAIGLLAEAFSHEDALQMLEPFVSEYGSEFYGLPLNEGTIRLELLDYDDVYEVPQSIKGIVPFYAGKKVRWVVAD